MCLPQMETSGSLISTVRGIVPVPKEFRLESWDAWLDSRSRKTRETLRLRSGQAQGTPVYLLTGALLKAACVCAMEHVAMHAEEHASLTSHRYLLLRISSGTLPKSS
jgi:hypothetical protein